MMDEIKVRRYKKKCGKVSTCATNMEQCSRVPNEVKTGKRWPQIMEVGKMGKTLRKMTKASNDNWTTVTKNRY